MKKALSIVISLIGLGMVLSGCVANSFKTTKVKDTYIQHYITENASVKPKKIGDSNIKFFVGKVEDRRGNHKYIFWKSGPFGIPGAKTKTNNITLTIRNITKEALFKTGWGITNDITNANYIINTKLINFGVYNEFLFMMYETDSILKVKNRKDGKLILTKKIKNHIPVISVGVDFSMQYKMAVGKTAINYYTALVDFFGSKEFKNAIMRDYFSRQDNSTKTKE